MKRIRFTKEQNIGVLREAEAKRLRALEDENGRLKRLRAEALLDNAGLKDLLSKNGNACRQAGIDRTSSGPA